jgi:predicted transcriptional regulator
MVRGYKNCLYPLVGTLLVLLGPHFHLKNTQTLIFTQVQYSLYVLCRSRTIEKSEIGLIRSYLRWQNDKCWDPFGFVGAPLPFEKYTDANFHFQMFNSLVPLALSFGYSQVQYSLYVLCRSRTIEKSEIGLIRSYLRWQNDKARGTKELNI